MTEYPIIRSGRNNHICPIVELNRDDFDYVLDGMQKRRNNAQKNHLKPRNGCLTDNHEGLMQEAMGMAAEVAGQKYLAPIEHHPFLKKFKNIPGLGDIAELGSFIDTKQISKSRDRLIVQIKEEDSRWEWAFLCISSHLVRPNVWPQPYVIYGWMLGRVARLYQITDPSYKNRDAYFNEKSLLDDPRELLELVNIIREIKPWHILGDGRRDKRVAA